MKDVRGGKGLEEWIDRRVWGRWGEKTADEVSSESNVADIETKYKKLKKINCWQSLSEGKKPSSDGTDKPSQTNL